MYIVTNDFDFQVRLIKADSKKEAIAKAKACITNQEMEEAGNRLVLKWIEIKRSWESYIQAEKKQRDWCEKNNMPVLPEVKYPYADIDPEIYRKVNLDEYDWEVFQEINIDEEVTILEGLCW